VDLQSVGYGSSVALADLDDDGDIDLMTGESNGDFSYFEQCAPPVAPSNNTPLEDLSLCTGESTTLVAAGTGTLGWYDAPAGGSFLGAGTSFLTGALSANTTFYVQDSTCAEGPRTAVAVTVNPIPNIATTLSGITLSAVQVGATYQWVTCPTFANATGTATNQNYTPSANGQYAVIVNNSGCVDTSACTTISTVGITQNEGIGNLAVYPNPTDGNFTIDLGQTHDQVMIQITNSLGQMVQNSVYNDVQLINLQLDSESGIYFVEITTTEGLKSKVKLVIK
jgi:Ig-like domain CHU_C associated/Secretion system C-terminal sorting domain